MPNFIAAVAVSSINLVAGVVIACWKQLAFGGVIALLVLSFGSNAHASTIAEQTASFNHGSWCFIAIFPSIVVGFIAYCLCTNRK